MKKLLSIIGAIGLGASAPAPLLANASTITKIEKNPTDTITIDGIEYKKQELKMTEPMRELINSLAVDSKDNLYFSIFTGGAYVLKSGETTPTKITGISSGVSSLTIDNKNNLYFGTDDGLYILKDGETTAKKITDSSAVIYPITVDKNNTVYFGTINGLYILKDGETTASKINGINGRVSSLVVDKNNNIYIGTGDGLYILKDGETTASKITDITSGVYSLAVDKNNNIYIGCFPSGLYVLRAGETTASKITGIPGRVYSLTIDNKNNIYYSSSYDVWKLTPIEKPIPPAPSNKLSGGAIAGIAIGSVAGAAFVVLGSCYLYKYIKKKQNKNTDTK